MAVEAYRANSKTTPEFRRVVVRAAPSAQATGMKARVRNRPKKELWTNMQVHSDL